VLYEEYFSVLGLAFEQNPELIENLTKQETQLKR